MKFHPAIITEILISNTYAWQQRTAYRIQVTLNDSSKIIDGTAELMYLNNSSFVLEKLYFHLYPNAYQPGSYLDSKHRAMHYFWMADLKEKDAGYCKVTHIGEAGAQPMHYQVDNTMMIMAAGIWISIWEANNGGTVRKFVIMQFQVCPIKNWPAAGMKPKSGLKGMAKFICRLIWNLRLTIIPDRDTQFRLMKNPNI